MEDNEYKHRRLVNILTFLMNVAILMAAAWVVTTCIKS